MDGKWLSDIHINTAQRLLKKQFPNLSGLFSTLILPNVKDPIPSGTRALQILHIKTNHWIVTSTLDCLLGEVKLLESMYRSIDVSTMNLLRQVFGGGISVTLEVP
uniref:Uncharacterized protein n=1 Tax=Amphimedon queenslandica TaxID=400682 RepID=A0A1X7UWM3_AMPQE